MRLTWRGLGCCFLVALTLMAAFSTANNLLFLLYASVVAVLLLSLLAGRWNIRRIIVTAEMPGQVFAGETFPLGLRLKNESLRSAFALRVSGGGVTQRLGPGEETVVQRRLIFPHRGLNRAEDLWLESSFPFGLLVHRRRLDGIEGTAFPRLREVHSAAEIEIDTQATGRPTQRKGAGDELFGIRDYDASDDSRLINWKLTAKSGKPLVNEFCSPGSSRMTVRLDSIGTGAEAERLITEAASAFRYYIDTGAEVRLSTPEGGVDYGKGVLHLEKALIFLAGVGEGKVARPAVVDRKPVEGVTDSPALRRITFLVSILVYGSMFLIDEIEPLFLASFFPLLIWGWFLNERGGPRLPKFLWDVLSFAVLVFIIFMDWRISGVAIANTHLVMYLMINRALVPLKADELAESMFIAYLAFLLVSGLSISPWYFLFFLAYLFLMAYWFMLSLGLSQESARAWRPAFGWLLAGGLVVVGVLFMVTPRVERFRRMNPFVSMGIDKLQSRGSAVASFTDDVTLGFFGNLKRSTARIMRVKPAGVPKGARPSPMRVRGEAFDRFDGRRWKKSRVDFRYEQDGKIMETVLGRAWAIKKADALVFPSEASHTNTPVEFTFYPINLSVLFTLEGTWAVAGANKAAYFDFTDSARFAAPYTSGVRYVVHTNPRERGYSRSILDYESILKERFLSTEGSNDRIAALALKITKESENDFSKTQAVKDFLEGYRYSTYSDSADTDLEDFLFDVKRGNCEYFATAAAVLLRHAGVPTRLVTGFYADDWNEYGMFFDVRQGQAHAWTEAYVDGRWMTVDATPSSGLLAAASAITARLQHYFSAIQARWYRHVIGYDHYVQKDTFLRLGLQFTQEALGKTIRHILLAAVFVAGVVVLAGGLRWLGAERGRKAGFFAKVQVSLERAGLRREPYWTPREYAAEIMVLRPELKAIAPLAELHYLESYSAQGITSEQVRETQRLSAELRTRLK